jgi:hypothetical protein
MIIRFIFFITKLQSGEREKLYVSDIIEKDARLKCLFDDGTHPVLTLCIL